MPRAGRALRAGAIPGQSLGLPQNALLIVLTRRDGRGAAARGRPRICAAMFSTRRYCATPPNRPASWSSCCMALPIKRGNFLERLESRADRHGLVDLRAENREVGADDVAAVHGRIDHGPAGPEVVLGAQEIDDEDVQAGEAGGVLRLRGRVEDLHPRLVEPVRLRRQRRADDELEIESLLRALQVLQQLPDRFLLADRPDNSDAEGRRRAAGGARAAADGRRGDADAGWSVFCRRQIGAPARASSRRGKCRRDRTRRAAPRRGRASGPAGSEA